MASRPLPTSGFDRYTRNQVQVPRTYVPQRDGNSVTSDLRAQLVQPLVLNTNIPAAPARVSLSTPLSTTSLSSPFSQLQSATTLPSSGIASRGISPMASRGTAAYNAPYNPAEWASGSRRTSRIETSGAQAEEGLASPPPPYSPPPARELQPTTSAGSEMSSTDSTFTRGIASQINTPTSTVGILSPVSQALTHARDSIGVRNSSQFIPPPPPPIRSSISSNRPLPLSQGRPSSISTLSLHMNSSQLYGDHPAASPIAVGMRPPNSRRAVSTGALSHGSSDGRESPNSQSSTRAGGWQPGMPLPGPPPGPPPSSTRSQSASAATDPIRRNSPEPMTKRAHRVPLRVPALGPVPPTPAGWTDDQPLRSAVRPHMPLHIETNLGGSGTTPLVVQVNPSSSDIMSESTPGPSSTPVHLARSTAVRDSFVRGLRERRNLRRSMQEKDFANFADITTQSNPWTDDLVSVESAARSPIIGTDTVNSFVSKIHTGLGHSGIQTGRSRSVDMERVAITASPSPTVTTRPASQPVPSIFPGKTLPTPPLSQKASLSAHSILPSTSSSVLGVEVESDMEAFTVDSLRRHQEFLEKEKAASTDLERLQLFANYVLAESSIRRTRYETAFSQGAFEVDSIRRQLFESSLQTNVDNEEELAASKDESSRANTPDASRETRLRPETMWWTDYHPQLSPIASMGNDELSSRGRAPSRWWESQTGSQSEGISYLGKRSKRESKYMGLTAAVMRSTSDEFNTSQINEDSKQFAYTEHVDEKANHETFGFYDENEPVMPTGVQTRQPTSPALLDISRFITLPPPYPRHYPAVNNNHPELTDYRNTVRALSDVEEIRTRKSRHQISAEALRNDHRHKIADGRQNFKSQIRSQLEDGSINYAEAAEAEEALKLDEHLQEQRCVKAEFDTLQDVVVHPLHDILNDRIAQLDKSIEQLRKKLSLDAEVQSPDRPQQEGDDTPELLEYMNQLKWLFDTREQMHKEIFNLLTERNEKYKSIVVLPYRQSNNQEKIRNTEAFFLRDSMERRAVFCDESLSRHQAFFSIIEDNVSRGIQLQSSAFWDIAPSLLEVLQRIPEDLNHFGGIAIPENEYLENPSYYQHPLQYLYLVLDHAEKSTYQFIESQVNLHCLLHEIKSSLVTVRSRSLTVQKAISTENLETGISPSTAELNADEESQLTAELKQKVSLIEEQWFEALGGQFQITKERIKILLQEHGGWDDIEQGDD